MRKDLREVALMIGNYLQSTARCQNPFHLDDEGLLNESPLLMMFFGPGIWKIDVNCRETVLRNELCQKKFSLGFNYAGIEAVATAQSVTGVPPVFCGLLQTEKVHFPSVSGFFEKEVSLTGADFHLQRVISVKQFLPINLLRKVFQLESNGFHKEVVSITHMSSDDVKCS